MPDRIDALSKRVSPPDWDAAVPKRCLLLHVAPNCTRLMSALCSLHGIVLDMIVFESHKLLKAEDAQGLPFATVFAASPG